jgi:hypothetical protein
MEKKEKLKIKINFQEIGKSLPLASLILIVFGYIKLYIFYNIFGIDITSYISISDLPLVLPPDLILLLTILTVFIYPFIATYLLDLIRLNRSSNENIIIIKDEEKKTSANNKIFIFIKYILIALLVIIMGVSLSLFLNSYESTERLTSIIIIIIVSILLLFLTFFNVVELHNNTMAVTSIIVLIAIFSLGPVRSTGEKVKHRYYNGTTVITKTDTLVADSNLIYIGKTSSHIFYLNRIEETQIVIPESEVTKLLIKRGFQGIYLKDKK